METKSPRPTLGFIVLRTFQTAQLLDFYRALGLSFTEEKHGRGPVHQACVLDGGLVLEIYRRYPGEADGPQDGLILGLTVDEVEPVLQVLAAAGFGPVPAPPAGAGRLLTANLKDPDGRKVILSVPK